MQAPVLHIAQGQRYWLTTQRCIYWEDTRSLILADLHFGKTGHFRKHGIPVPQKSFREDLQRLLSVASHFQPQRLIIVGDLFHSAVNREMELFLRWRDALPCQELVLVQGNHDILHPSWYQEAGITLYRQSWQWQQTEFIHDTGDAPLLPGYFRFSGHLHPGVQISGAGKQSLQFPCYYFSETGCFLPAFSRFSGMAIIRKKKKETVYAIVNQSLIPLV
ncbi:MAG TPA: ligase-associated DNA damage response endonuclease PdeM [Sediminibacterium sp.]|nr:ligase-associated DNA damage response endonuclease PdeM [Sediminibacterium sp.]